MRVLVFYGTRDLIPLYGLYSLLFRDAGLSASAVSVLFVVWSLTAFVLEVPSGAWADSVDRRLLLVLSGLVLAAAYSCWMVWPTYAGFAAGFVLWGLSGSLVSGTFEALVFDELTARGEAADYPRLIGWAHSVSIACVLLSILSAGPLFAWGGYAVVGWSSVAVALVHTASAYLLPAAPPAAPADGTDGRYLTMLRSGLREAAGHRAVRGAVVVAALVVGCSAYDEYFGLLARDQGAGTTLVPVVVGVIALGELVGTSLAGRTAGMSGRTLGLAVAASAVCLSVGAVAPSLVATTVATTVGYAVLANAMVVSEARLQAVISGPARATVTSVSGVSTEVVALSVYAFMALGTTWWSTATVLALWGLPVLVVAVTAGRLLPPAPEDEEGTGR